MALCPNSASTYAAIGYCQVLMGQCKKAAELFHKALALKRDDTFSTNMLNYVLELLVDEYQEPVKPDNEFMHVKPFFGNELFLFICVINIKNAIKVDFKNFFCRKRHILL